MTFISQHWIKSYPLLFIRHLQVKLKEGSESKPGLNTRKKGKKIKRKFSMFIGPKAAV